MSSRRIATFFLGLWLGAALLSAWVIVDNLRSASRLLDTPNPTVLLLTKPVGKSGALALLRYHAAEQNRRLLETWNTVQIVMAAAFFLALLFGSKEGKVPLALAFVMLVLTALQLFLLVPELVAIGRTVEFIPAGAPSQERTRYTAMQFLYGSAEVLKWIAGLLLAAHWARHRTSRSGNARKNLDLVDKPDHSHVNR